MNKFQDIEFIKSIQKEARALLDIKSVRDMNFSELELLASGIRARILDVVSKNGGHLSSTLGAVELIVGMHASFDYINDPFIYDVSHQAYAHKLLTGRWEEFASLRQFGGISGFTKPSEKDADYFIAGHSSTSVSLGVGAAKSFRLNGQDRVPIVLIGDGAMSAGLVYEALNELGMRKYPMIIILNDNEMSISKPIGAISNYLSQALTSKSYRNMRSGIKSMLNFMPKSASYLARRTEESLKLITPGLLFEELGCEYIGPINGHDFKLIISTLKKARSIGSPVIVHAQTTKGKGYELAEGRFEKWHGVGTFDIASGEFSKKSNIDPTKVFSLTLKELAKENPKIVGVSAAMPSGTGLDALIEFDGNRFFDVAIAEAHAVTSMASMAKEGYVPFVAIYSTFLQRAFDEIVHDVGIMNLPVRFAIDRAGIVGEDGETHQGLLDIAYLRIIPNMVLFAPRDNESLKKAVVFASKFSSAPCAFRYPRGKFVLEDGIFAQSDFELGRSEVLKEGRVILLLGYGNGVGRAYECYKVLESRGLSATLVDLRFVKPLDEIMLRELFSAHSKIFVFSDSYFMGGVASALMEFASVQNLNISIHSFEIKDVFVTHGKSDLVEKSLGLSTSTMCEEILKIINT